MSPVTTKSVHCPTCNTSTVVPLREDPPGVQLWQCAHCGEVKRWCPTCNQGWVMHYVERTNRQSLYCCDECDSAWDELSRIGTEAMCSMNTLEYAVTLVRDIEPMAGPQIT